MQLRTTTFTITNLTPLLTERLELWDQQDVAQRAGEFHKALLLERRIRQLRREIRVAIGLADSVPLEQGQ